MMRRGLEFYRVVQLSASLLSGFPNQNNDNHDNDENNDNFPGFDF